MTAIDTPTATVTYPRRGTIALAFDRPVTREEASAFCVARHWWGYEPGPYGGSLSLHSVVDGRGTFASYTHRQSCD